ncbi:MAG: helix-turn-helix transcriptional regulator [Solobacterium sp.]|nr:helix-turn-helix transcriptional regulator [Solobacterium sp.]MBQ9824635.1 helix-turn-helix transcriptional regulator [Solobacterium sp.]
MFNESLPVIDMQATGRNIEKLRRLNRLKVVDVQDYFDFNTPQAIYKWERGRSLPSLENLLALAKIYNCAIEDIIVVRDHKP